MDYTGLDHNTLEYEISKLKEGLMYHYYGKHRHYNEMVELLNKVYERKVIVEKFKKMFIITNNDIRNIILNSI